MKKRVQKWFDSLPRIERDQRLVVYEGRAYTPSEILTEVKNGSGLGEKLQEIIEARRFTSIENKYGLALIRVKERLEKLPKEFRIVFEGKMYSPEDMLKEIQEGTRVGRAFVEAEIKRIEEVLSQK